MNVIDLVIIGSIGLLALIGLKGGIIRPASGIGGIVLGVVVGLNYQAQMAAMLAPYISGETLPRLLGFAIVAVPAFALVKGAALAVNSAFPRFKTGLVDHVAGALGGLAVGVLLLGTLMHMAGGVDVAPTREVVDTSLLAPKVAKASLVSPSIPWCSSGESVGCNSYSGLVNDTFGVDVKAKLLGMLGEDQDVDQIVGLVKATLNGDSPEQLIQISNESQ